VAEGMDDKIKNDVRKERERLLERRVIVCDEVILPKSAQQLWTDLLELTSGGDVRPITFYINSAGGSLHDGLAMGGMVESCIAPVHTVAVSRVCSAAMFPFAAGKVRYAYPHTTFVVHDFTAMLQGKVSELVSAIKYYGRVKEEIAEFLAKRTTPDKDWWSKKFATEDEQDYWFNVKEAVEIGLVDRIIQPGMKNILAE
jgi:ATP-dependent Clp protease, protease subunit